MRHLNKPFQFSGSQARKPGAPSGASKSVSPARAKRTSLPPTNNARAKHAAKKKKRGDRRGQMASLFQSMRAGRGQQQGAQGPVKRVAARGRNPMRAAPRRPERKSPGMTGYQRFTKPYGRSGHGRR